MTSLSVALLLALCFGGGFLIISQLWTFVQRRSESDGYYRRVLGVETGADADALRSAYESRMAKYDPAKFVEFGPEFEALASARTKVIMAAYDHLLRR